LLWFLPLRLEPQQRNKVGTLWYQLLELLLVQSLIKLI
jgi:hypothetical protein